jgi:excinuclease UvrABC ATPase subunit
MRLKDDVEYVNNWFLNVIDKGSCLYDAWDRIRAALSETDNIGQKVTSNQQGKGEICPICGGTGEVDITPDRLFDTIEKCRACNGTGKTPPVA